ncbi:hypothetical protein J3F84DRAFT_258813 [Trichoderma pleuroticola]
MPSSVCGLPCLDRGCIGRNNVQGKGRVLAIVTWDLLFIFIGFFYFTLKLRAWCLFIYSSCLLFPFSCFVSALFKRVLNALFLSFFFFSFFSSQVRALSPFCHLYLSLFFLAWILLCLILCFLACSIVQVATIAY